MASRVIFDLILVAAWFLLPGFVVIALAMVGAILFSWYIEGIFATFWLEVFLGPIVWPGLVLPPLMGTVAVTLAFLIGDFARERLIIYND